VSEEEQMNLVCWKGKIPAESSYDEELDIIMFKIHCNT
jgi:hypothetical protein